MRNILFILGAILFFTSSVYAGQFEQICKEIGYDEDSEKFSACVEKLSKRKKPLNSGVTLAEEADSSPLIGAIAISSATALAVDAMSGSSSEAITSGASSSSEGAVNESFVRNCVIGVFKCNGF